MAKHKDGRWKPGGSDGLNDLECPVIVSNHAEDPAVEPIGAIRGGGPMRYA